MSSGKARRWEYHCLLAVEIILVVLLLAGGCYSKQDYHVLPSQAGDEILNRCNIVIEARIVSVERRDVKAWQEHVFFCWPFEILGPEVSRPARLDLYVEVRKVLKGQANLPPYIHIENCRWLTEQELATLGQKNRMPQNLPVQIGFNSRHGNSFRNLVIVPLGSLPTTNPTTRLSHAAAAGD